MITSITYDTDEREMKELLLLLKDSAARFSEDEWKMHRFSILEHLREYMDQQHLVDIAIYDVSQESALGYLARIRENYREMKLMIVADTQMSPMAYLKPGIQASSLLLRPFKRHQAQVVVEEFVSACISAREQGDMEQFYIIESKEGTITIPYRQIYFFEAREKKIYICAGKEEFGFYHTIDKLEEELPEQFARCHRSFIVNTKKIRKIVPSQNVIYLSDGFDVPLSRSYKASMKGLGK